MSSIITKITAFFMSVITFISTGLGTVDTNNYRKMLLNACESYLHSSSDDCIDEYLRKTGGIVKGVCHPNGNYQQIKDANIQWVRMDLSAVPYDINGNPSPAYQYYKNVFKGYADNGIKVLCVTPYPCDYIEAGYDPRTPEGKEKVREIAEFYANDLQGIVSGFQITNEMGLENFTVPLTMEEAAEFVGIQLEAMQNIKGNIVTGFNLGGVAMYNFCELMKPYIQYCDYVGIDIYLGCFENVFKIPFVYDLLLRYVWNYTHMPVMVNEFGYIGYGESKSEQEKEKILQSYGFNSEEEARADIRTFISRLPADFQDYLSKLDSYGDDTAIGNRIFDTEVANHLYRELPKGFRLINYPHTPKGQADCLRDSVKHFRNLDFVCGAFAYCYSDSKGCYICGQSDCPVETGWGLVDGDGKPKPSYYALRDAFADWKK